MSDPRDASRVFPANLGVREKLFTFAVGYGVGIGVPLVLGVAFAVGFGQPLFLLFPLPLVLVFGAAFFLRPTGFGVSATEVSVFRPAGPKIIPMRDVRGVVSPATEPKGLSIGLARVDGFYGCFGIYWNREWGRYRVYVTNRANRVELRMAGGSRVVISPDDPRSFVLAVRDAAAQTGVGIVVELDP